MKFLRSAKWMKHETINSVVAVLSLLLSTTVFFVQFGPKSDALVVTNEGEIRHHLYWNEEDSVVIATDSKKNKHVLGFPSKWKVRLYNPSSRAVSVTSFRVTAEPFPGKPIEDKTKFDSAIESILREALEVELPVYPALAAKINETWSDELSPIRLQPQQAVDVVIAPLHFFYRYEDDEHENCILSTKTINDIKNCYAERGKNVYGAAQKIHPNIEGEYIVDLNDDANPHYRLQVNTGDGSTYSVSLRLDV